MLANIHIFLPSTGAHSQNFVKLTLDFTITIITMMAEQIA